jgi:hypothetical protein
MPHHFQKNTVEASVWCDKCNKNTIHSVWDGRRGSCLVCLEKREKQIPLPGIEASASQPEQLPLIDIVMNNWRGDK